MSVTVTLEEEELYLAALLDDPSGLDLAEFCWLDEEADDGCFRAWDYQWAWWRNDDPYQIDQAGRSLGKSVGITMRAFAFPFKAPGQEMLVTAPELNHLRPLTDQIEHRLTTTRLTRELLPAVKGMGIARQPHFQVRFTNNARIITRLPNKDGKGVKGQHPIHLEMDECLPAGTLVLTRRGQVPIEQVTIQDEVFTHRGRWRRVTNVFDRGERDTVVLRGYGHPGLEVTPNHKFWVRLGRQAGHAGLRRLTDPEFVPCGDLPLPGWKEKRDAAYWASPAVFPSDAAPGFKRRTNHQRVPCRQTEDFFWLAGVYLADGSVSKSNPKLADPNKTWLSIADRQVHEVTAALDRLGLPWSLAATKGACKNIMVASTPLAGWFAEHCGRGAANKEVPTWALGLREVERRALLAGLIFGDGFLDPDARYAPGRWKLTTTSKRLAISAKLLAQSLGYCVTLFLNPGRPTQIRGRVVNSGSWYQVVGNTRGQAHFADGQIFGKVKARTAGRRVRVYDLAVDEDHSFVADGITVHNSQDYPLAGWVELIETLKRGSKGFTWRCHGVSRGVRDKFYELTQESSGWTVHRLTAVHRPTWDDAERQAKIREYGGSRDNPDYKRNIFGEHGDATNPLFVLARLMAIVRQDAEYNDDIYACRKISYELVANAGTPIQTFLDLPGSHLVGYSGYYGGMDVGFTADPSEILVFGEQVKTGKLRLLTRIQLARVHAADQRRVITALFDFYGAKLRRFAMDKTGLGLPIWQDMLTEPISGANDRVIGYNFSGLYPVEVEDRPLKPGEKPADLVIKKNIKDWSSDQLRHWVDQRVLELPFDRELLSEWQGQSYSVAPQAGNPYGRRSYSAGSYHTLDAGRMFAAAKGLEAIEAMLAKPVATEGPVLDVFVGAGY